MKIGFIGLGKLGLPCAIGMAMKNHVVYGFDINPDINSSKKIKDLLFTQEKNQNKEGSIFDDITDDLQFLIKDDIQSVIHNSELIFVAIQTPHSKIYEGDNILPETRSDFDYTYLIECINQINMILEEKKTTKIVSIISTVLPGTLRKYIIPNISSYLKLCYNPYFIAMGTVLYDFFNPEFILLGKIDETAEKVVTKFYETICSAKVFSTSLENAEMIKVSYNTIITTKIVLVNNIMEMCHRLSNTNVDDVMAGLKLANRRIISTAYMNGGMGDGGGCHPRDNIAMSWLSNELKIKDNFYDYIMKKREHQTEFIADIVEEYKNMKENQELDIVILGMSFKPNTNLITGSCSVLLKNILVNRKFKVITHDPIIEQKLLTSDLYKAIYIIGCQHDVFKKYDFTEGSIVIDPTRFLKICKHNVTYVPIGIS